MSDERASLPLAVRAFRLLRRALLPRELHARYGETMHAAFVDLYREARTDPEPLGRARLLGRELRSLLHTALRERTRGEPDSLPLHRRTSSPSPTAPSPVRSAPPRTPRRTASMLENIVKDLGFGLRVLRHSPVFATVAILTLALGIGANTAVFSVVNGVLLQPLPYDEPEELTLVWTNFGPDLPQNWVSGPEYVEMRDLSSAFEDLGGVYPGNVTVTGAGEPEQVPVALVSGPFFGVMQAEARLGRLLGPEDDVQGAFNVVLGHGYWQRRFAGDPGIVGDKLVVNGIPATIVGVLEPGFDVMHPDASFPERTDLWAPIVPVFDSSYEELSRGSHGMRVFGRLKEGVSLQQAQADMDSVAARIEEIAPDYYDFEGWGITVLSLHDDLVEDARPALLILMGAVGFVLLIACVNVANLMITRALSRERELAVRTALGARRRRLVQQLFTESLVLALIGAGLGLAMAFGMVGALAAAAPETLPRVEAIRIDGTVLLFTLGIGVLTAVLFGVAPGWFAVRSSVVDSLKEGGRGTTAGRGGNRVRMALVVGEVALALVLLVGAGLMVRSFAALLETDPGYRTERLLTMRVNLPSQKYDGDAAELLFRQLEERVSGLGEVESAGLISQLPLSGSGSSGTTIVDGSDAVEPPRDDFPHPYIEADRRRVTGRYMETVGMQLREGRLITERDTAGAAPVAVVDEEFARRFWPGESALGRRLAISWSRDEETGELQPDWREIVGVVRHARHGRLSAVGREQVYVPVSQSPVTSMYLAVRTAGDPATVTSAVRRQVAELDPEQPVYDVRTMTERLSASVAQPRFNTLLLGGFAVIALLLAAVGLYGVISYAVGQRTNEIGIRMALGARARSVQGMVLRQGLMLVAAGLVIGVAVAVGVTRLIERLLYAISPTDPLTYVGVAAILTVVATLACLVPALRATRVEPVIALREE